MKNHKEELLTNIKELEAKVEELKAKVNEIPEVKDLKGLVTDPQFDQFYWWLDHEGNINRHKWAAFSGDFASLGMGNIFYDRESAEDERDRRRVVYKLQKASKGFKSTYEQSGWVIVYNRQVGKFLIRDAVRAANIIGGIPNIVFENKSVAQHTLESLTDRELEVLKP